MAALVLADAHAFGMIAVRAEGGVAVRALAALALAFTVSVIAVLALLAHLLGEGLHELLETAHGLDLGLLLIREELVGDLLQPFRRNVGNAKTFKFFKALKDVPEDLIESIEVLLVLHQGGPGEVVEVVDIAVDHALVHRLHEHQVLLEGHGDLGLAEFGEETHEHGGRPLAGRTSV